MLLCLLQVGAYARKFRYLQHDHDEASQRLHAVERLLRQYDCSTSLELLTGVAEAEADLDKWYQMEGQAVFDSLCNNFIFDQNYPM